MTASPRPRADLDLAVAGAEAPLALAGAGGRLPRQLTTFVGRQHELEQVAQALEDHRLVTICGPGGAGKTRLALELGELLTPRFPDGIHFVDLSTLTDPQLVPSTIAMAAGVRERPDLDVRSALQQALRDRRALLILDNCEHLVDACADQVFALLQACPRPRLLATSREPLQVPGELSWRLPPLTRPSQDEPPVPARLAGFDSVRLFLDRARGFQPDFELNGRTAPAVARICDLMEGIPLAIELAAGRLTVLDVDQLAEQLHDALHLLTGGSPSLPSRQRTLRAAIDWSFRRLGRSERLLFTRLSVFPGPADLEAVRAVCADESLLAMDVLDTLARLVDKSLLQAQTSGDGLRYRLLETLRQYAEGELHPDEALELRARHAAYYVKLAEAAEREQRAGRMAPWISRLGDQRPNLRAALAWSIREDPRQALRLGAALAWLWHTNANLAEGRRWLERALETAAAEPALRARALHGAGRIAYRQGDLEAARALLEEALEIHRGRGDEARTAGVLRSLGLVLLSGDDYAGASGRLEESLGIVRRLGAELEVERTLGSLGLVALAQGDLAAAGGRLDESVEIARRLDDDWGLATSVGSAGELALEVGDLASARAALEESLRVLVRLGDGSGVAYRLEGLARVAASEGAPERALLVAAGAARLRARLGAVAAPHWRRRLEADLVACREAMPGPEAAAAETAGARLDMRATVRAATGLNQLSPGPAAGPVAVPHWASPEARAAGLSAREWELLGRLIGGASTRQIAKRLAISPEAAKRELAVLVAKLGARGRAQAVAAALGLAR